MFPPILTLDRVTSAQLWAKSPFSEKMLIPIQGVITRLCIEDSVESRMVMLQEKKANMINGTINNDQVAMEKLTPEDMQFLFRGS